MIKILNAQETRAADLYTIEHEPISSLDLMERAAYAAFRKILALIGEDKGQQIDVLCGPGNNGGDGFVIARYLHEEGFNVRVILVDFDGRLSEDCQKNKDRYKGQLIIHSAEQAIPFGDVLIDALFGSGLNRKIEGWLALFVTQCNQAYGSIISIDMPSGLFDEENEHHGQMAIEADHTLSFQHPKLCMMFPENANYVGALSVIDIGLHPAFIQSIDTPYYWVQAADIVALIKSRHQHAHKGSFGHGLLIAGEYGKGGAAVLAARSALRSGIGLLTVAVPSILNTVLQVSVSEAMTIDSGECYFEHELELPNKCTALAIGPGLGTSEHTKAAFERVLASNSLPLILDADAINILAANEQLLSLIPANTIFTPHPGEFRRLVGDWNNDYERLKKQMNFSVQYKSIVILKGKNTSISTPEGLVYFNPTGNPGMATGGSGDVLTGVLLGLLAQSYSPIEACLMAVYVHGLSGDVAAKQKGEISLIASDIVSHLSDAFLTLLNLQESQCLDE